MNRRTRPSISHQFHKYLKPGALARIRDSRISARSHRINSLCQIPLHRASPPSSPLQSSASQPPVNVAAEGFPFFVGRMHGPRCLQRKKLMAAKSVFFISPSPANHAPDSPDPVIDSFGNDVLVAN